MKKGFLVVLALAIAFSTAMAQEKVTLNVLNYQQADQAGYQEDVAIWERFQQQNPDITLNIEVLFSEPYHQKLQVYAAAGTLPDVFYVWPTARSAIIHEKKLAKDLAQLLGADFLKDFSGAAINPNNQLGKYMAMLPQSFTYTSVMYVNKKLLADNGFDLPKTYEDLKRMVPKLKAKGRPQEDGAEAQGQGHQRRHAAEQGRLADAVLSLLYGAWAHGGRCVCGRNPGGQGQVYR